MKKPFNHLDPNAWKARRRGDVYCAPACGGQCTWAAYQKAKQDAKALCTRLGKGWKPRVWENLGWHYSAISPCGRLKVHPSIYQGRVEGYTAFLGEANSSGGRWTGSSRSPRRAIVLAVKEGREAADEVQALVEGL